MAVWQCWRFDWLPSPLCLGICKQDMNFMNKKLCIHIYNCSYISFHWTCLIMWRIKISRKNRKCRAQMSRHTREYYKRLTCICMGTIALEFANASIEASPHCIHAYFTWQICRSSCCGGRDSRVEGDANFRRTATLYDGSMFVYMGYN